MDDSSRVLTEKQPLASVRYLYPPHRARRLALKVGFELDARRAAVAFYRPQRTPQILFGGHLFHQIVVHHFLSGVSRLTLRFPPASARRGSTASALACSPSRSPSGEGPGGPGLRETSSTQPFAPAPEELSPGKALILFLRAVRLYLDVFVWILGFAVASTLTARTRPLCRFVFLQSK